MELEPTAPGCEETEAGGGAHGREDTEAVGRVLEAAELCFGEHGYSGTSMREIAEGAGVSKSLVHYHFGSKEQLYLEVLMRVYQRLADRVREAVGEEGTPTERALFAVDALFESLLTSPDFQTQAKVWAHAVTDERLRPHAKRIREHVRAEMIRTLAELVGPTEADWPVPLEAAADLLWAAVGGLGLSATTDSPERTEAALGAFRSLIVIALGEAEREAERDRS